VTKTLVDLDDDLLAEASRTLGTATKKDTVSKALQEVVDLGRARRREAHERIQQLADEGAFNWDLLPTLDD
jgi:Arc/MetJ family transcription regulator